MPETGDGTKWIFVTGGVLSGLGKGLVSSSVSKLLQDRGQEVVPIKCDGYLNVDPGTMNPHEHGEVFVLGDGTEVDMDFGHYERFLEVEGRGEWNLTSGKIFQSVIDKEREGEYLGKTVQMVPHVTDEIKSVWKDIAREEEADIVAIELGGTVGDMENSLFLETARQMRREEDAYLIHTTLVPYLETTGEQKTKPTQHSVKKLRELGLEPDMIVGRSEDHLEPRTREKIAITCNVPEKAVISNPTLDNVYRLPLLFDRQNVDELVAESFDLPERENGMDDWRRRVENMDSDPVANVAICGKYTDMDDSYASVEEALKHAAAEKGGSIGIDYIPSEDFELGELDPYDGVVIPGGFGCRGVEGKMDAIQYCRQNDTPVLGLCYGLQLMVIEYARNMLGLDAYSEEFVNSMKSEDSKILNESSSRKSSGDFHFTRSSGTGGSTSGEEHLVVSEMPEQKDIEEMGGTMRLGAYTANIEGQVAEIYGDSTATERHRHRYEVDPQYHGQLENNGLKISGITRDGELAEYIELPEHPFFIGTQAHPEFTSTFQSPNPLYLAFIQNCM